jgi:transcriptional regulator with XRE-family HTH domain
MGKPEPMLTTPGQRIVWLRENKKMLQVTLARTIGISGTALSKIESGKSKSPSASTLLKIAAVFEANPDWIMHGRGRPFEIDTQITRSEMLEVFDSLSGDAPRCSKSSNLNPPLTKPT